MQLTTSRMPEQATCLPGPASLRGSQTFSCRTTSLLLANLKGLGHLFVVTAAMASVTLSSNVALIGGNSTKPDSSYYALIEAAFSLTTKSVRRYRQGRASNVARHRLGTGPDWGHGDDSSMSCMRLHAQISARYWKLGIDNNHNGKLLQSPDQWSGGL